MTILFCDWEMKCSKKWETLKDVGNKLVRECGDCGKPVHLVTTVEQIEKAAMDGTCVAFFEGESTQQHLAGTNERNSENKEISTYRVSRMTLGLPSSVKRQKK